ncbi:hypothetical protein STSP2_01597 [Anaerohalosphaera lusitana]|uniref:DUF4056 domain-containing protein n=1 Tax=Anaerohalosphaera lusitana TaxID=1936003 RepID=A0A1U9NKG8_9BACT|nr:DUF4056 domain-containing protein [Anaerohalosphaera lusitana]AQT68433.1 hypothetical protein STSP2_01597 [Anaerohalosphaera lusitana]
MNRSSRKTLVVPTILTILSIALLASGCSLTGKPRPRYGNVAADVAGTKFIELDDLGSHSRALPFGEHNGILYTARGGHIDTAHLRIAVDHTRWLHDEIHDHLTDGDTRFKFKMNVEPTRHYVNLEYPENWDTLSPAEKERIIDEISLDFSQYMAYNMVNWHEVLTWFKFKSLVFFSEFQSAFSWEDTYSNLLGTRIGAIALQDKTRSFDDAVTYALNRELQFLDVQSSKVAHDASESVKNKWYKGYLACDTIRRNMDIGVDDGYVSPALVPGVCGDPEPVSYPAPTIDSLVANGFKVDIEIKTNWLGWNKIARLVYDDPAGKPIKPLLHWPTILQYIHNDAIAQGCLATPTNRIHAAADEPRAPTTFKASKIELN